MESTTGCVVNALDSVFKKELVNQVYLYVHVYASMTFEGEYVYPLLIEIRYHCRINSTPIKRHISNYKGLGTPID